LAVSAATAFAISTKSSRRQILSARRQNDECSTTVGDTQIVDELVISFTHTTVIDWMLPGVAPTGKPVEAAFVVVVGCKDGKITHEHIYWIKRAFWRRSVSSIRRACRW